MTKITEYVEQPDAWTCQSACVAQMLGLDTDNVPQIRYALEQIGEPGDPYVMGQYLRPRVEFYDFKPNASLDDLVTALQRGFKCITHGWFTSSGHVISVVGYRADKTTLGTTFVVDDPWYEFDFSSGTYTRKSGDNVLYSAVGMYSYCVASQSYEHARELYAARSLSMLNRNMWLHTIGN